MSLDSAETALALCCEAAQEPSENIKWSDITNGQGCKIFTHR